MIGPLTANNGTLAENHVEMATVLNNYFVTVFTIEGNLSEQQNCQTVINERNLSHIKISEADVL